jgi:hypothetical protein
LIQHDSIRLDSSELGLPYKQDTHLALRERSDSDLRFSILVEIQVARRHRFAGTKAVDEREYRGAALIIVSLWFSQ